jgi:RNA polymerase-binding transcription factor DksA
MNWMANESDARAALESERLSAVARVRAMTVELEGLAADSGDANGDDEHDPEGSTLAYERARVAALLTEAESNLGDLDSALTKLKAGNYSVCEACGEKIPPERLETLPAARRCFHCATAPLPVDGPRAVVRRGVES